MRTIAVPILVACALASIGIDASAANIDPLPTAVAAAEAYWWHAQPCDGHFTVQWEGPADYWPADMAAGWATWNSPTGRGDESAPTAIRTECVAAIQTNDWTPDWWRHMYRPYMGEARGAAITQYRLLCRIVTHEIGHLLGWKHEWTNPRGVMYGRPLTLRTNDKPCDRVPHWVTSTDEMTQLPHVVVSR